MQGKTEKSWRTVRGLPEPEIKDGDTIILDAGTTTLALAQLLKDPVKSIFVITCSVPAALELSSAGNDIPLLGGMLRNKSLALLLVKPAGSVRGRGDGPSRMGLANVGLRN
jgi:hypothetical protein